jgi:hypothetical protein
MIALSKQRIEEASKGEDRPKESQGVAVEERPFMAA